MVCVAGVFGGAATARAAAPDTWQLLTALPATLQNPVEALAVDPHNSAVVLAGTQSGAIYRSADAGAHWVLVGHKMGRSIDALTFDPAATGQVLAATGGAGIWVSTDDGATWHPTPSTRKDWVRAISVGDGVLAAGTHKGVLLSTDGTTWTPAGLGTVDVSALTVVTGGAKPTIVAGGDGELSGQPLPLYQTQNGGATWTSVSSTVPGSSMVSSLVTLPPADGASAPTVVLGTNGGLFKSTDGGAHWAPDNAGGALPPVDMTSLAVAGTGGTGYYAASDGGGSTSGGLWLTRDGGATFASLRAPILSVTALAVVGGDPALVYAASFRPIDHAVMLWSYDDTGGAPRPPAQPVPTPLPGSSGVTQPSATINWVHALSHGPETPFLVLSAIAILLLLTALGAYARSARRF